MEITINLDAFNNFLALPPAEMLLQMILTIGWIPISVTFLWGFWQIWIQYIQDQWGAKQKYIFLAIDIPRNNEQSPRAVENLFSYLAGAHASINLIEKYWEGKFQLSFSLEIVSIGGYTQFLIRTPDQFRDLVESAVYSQYPDAEITEVEDYTTEIPSVYPNDDYDIWGAEFIQAENPAYPIRTYEDFEHIFGPPEKNFRDPMASLMDLCSSLMEGEQLWYQIILRPIGFDWITIGEKEISKVIGEKVKSSENIFEKLFNGFLDLIGEATGIFILPQPAAVEEKQSFNMMGLKPVQKKQIEAIQDKISKLGFEVKIRMIYVAKKEVMNKQKVANGFTGFIKQFAYNDLNNIKPDMKHTATKTEYLFKESRLKQKKLSLMTKYKKRSTLGWAMKGKVYNVQELATIWHFPIESVVRAPLIQKAPGRKAEPPISLPMAEEVIRSDEEIESIFKRVEDIRRAPVDLGRPPEVDSIFESETASDTAGPPENLPFV
jgi:hypothetical protein